MCSEYDTVDWSEATLLLVPITWISWFPYRGLVGRAVKSLKHSDRILRYFFLVILNGKLDGYLVSGYFIRGYLVVVIWSGVILFCFVYFAVVPFLLPSKKERSVSNIITFRTVNRSDSLKKNSVNEFRFASKWVFSSFLLKAPTQHMSWPWILISFLPDFIVLCGWTMFDLVRFWETRLLGKKNSNDIK